MKTNYNYKNLGAGIVLQAVKDFFEPDEIYGTRKSILKHLKSPQLVALSDGLSLVAAEQLENNPQEIAERLGREELYEQIHT